ncbi:hypothetical protein ONE63_001070 [Megalurothrips usitatus]|uniref:Uncharacterized protein n=1 Tax=Megalurothrips usitatus TaxID=439358 RepID=A0AAV7XD30_9NEOP|nr:hypothetical protein ONE63_001070 [Megalurothrips usitatus]
MNARTAAKAKGLSHGTLQRHIQKHKDVDDLQKAELSPTYSHRQVFTQELEEKLETSQESLEKGEDVEWLPIWKKKLRSRQKAHTKNQNEDKSKKFGKTCKKTIRDEAKKQPPPKKSRKTVTVSSDSDSDVGIVSEGERDHDSKDQGKDLVPENFETLEKLPEEGDFVLVQFSTAKENKYYVGKVLKGKDKDDDIEVS